MRAARARVLRARPGPMGRERAAALRVSREPRRVHGPPAPARPHHGPRALARRTVRPLLSPLPVNIYSMSPFPLVPWTAVQIIANTKRTRFKTSLLHTTTLKKPCLRLNAQAFILEVEYIYSFLILFS